MWVLGLTKLQELGIVATIVFGFGAVAVAALNAWQGVRNERKRTQPIVVAHQEVPRHSASLSERYAVGASITNEGTGAAFNVSFGVEIHKVRIPYKHDYADPGASIYRIVKQGQRLPISGSWAVEFDRLLVLSKIANPDMTSVFWARYENAQGKRWETLNPGDRAGYLDIKRVRFVWLREWRDELRRKRALTRGRKNELAVVRDLQANGQPEPPE